MQASTLVRPDRLKMPHGPDPQPYLDAVDGYAKAGYRPRCCAWLPGEVLPSWTH